jgi:hypothetical protein
MKLSRIALVALVACSDATTTPPTQLNLDRPIDVSFACYGGLRITNGGAATDVQPIKAMAQPVESCTIRSGTRAPGATAPPPPGQEDLSASSKVGAPAWFAFVLQSGTGTVAVAKFDTKPSASFGGNDVQVLDADHLTPGKNSISVGEDPVAIATDKIGCFEVVANAGSCDMSTLDVKSAADAALGLDVEPVVTRMDVKNAAGERLRARPAAMAFEPAGGVIGDECPATPTGLAYIAYPSCHLVAAVDVSTGTIVTAISFDAAGVPTVIPNGSVSCPAECDGAAATPGVRPVAVDIEKDARTGRVVLAIGSDNSNVLTAYDLDTLTSLPLSRLPIPPLENTNGRLGLTAVAITPVIGMGGDNGSTTGIVDDLAPGGDHQFIYAVANDGSVRVADISGAPRECDANVDPRYLLEVRDVNRLACLAVGDPATPPRRAGVRGPGIELLGDAIPTSVDVVKVDWLGSGDTRTPGLPLKMIGYFGMISAANGQAFIFNVDNDDFADFVPGSSGAEALAAPIPLDIPHQLRDNYPGRGLLAESGGKFVCNDDGPDPDAAGGNSGGPRLLGSIQTSVPAGTVALEKSGGLPSIRQVFCDIEGVENDRPVSELFFSAPPEVRAEVFPDLRALRADETWTLTYEGALSGDKVDTAIDGPVVRTSQIEVDAFGMHLIDATGPFCEAGVEPYDIVQIRGCDPSIGDAGCPVGYTCYVHPQSQVTGIGACMLSNEAEQLSNACKAFLTTVRRYTIGRTTTGELQLLPRKAVLRTTPINGCDSDAQCEALADYAAQTGSTLHPSDPDLPTDPKTWRCQPDPDRRPLNGTGQTGKRCLLTCDEDADCSFGTVCSLHPGAAPQMGYCMEGVVPPQSCVNAPQRYELRAGEAFTMLGSRQGYMHPIIADSGDVCVRNPNAPPALIGRIPLDPPACDPFADPRTGKKTDGTYDANPCKVTVDETEYQLNYNAGSCTLQEGNNEDIVTRPATGIRFRNRAMTLTLVDPTYQGDLTCNGDRLGTLTNVPLVMPGYQLAFRQTAGFAALTVLGISPALPIKVLRGPTESFWLIDEGDFLSTSLSQASTRGKVFRIEGRAINIINLLE